MFRSQGGKSVMNRTTLRRTRLLLAAGATLLLLTNSRPAAAASEEDCRAFHRDCTEARAAGYREVGICNVERLECPTDRDAEAPRRARDARDGHRNDPESSVGERSVGK